MMSIFINLFSKDEIWDFISDKNQNLIISVEVPKVEKDKKPQSGCIAVVIGFAY